MRSEAMEYLSKLHFGQTHRLALLIAIVHAPNGRVNPTELSFQLGLAQSAFQKPLKELLEAGLVRHEVDRRRNVYVRQDSKIWDWVLELEAQVRKREQLANVRDLRSS